MNVLDLFAGLGGLSYGFSTIPGYKILVANEINKEISKEISKAYTLNHPETTMLNCDIADLTEELILSVLNGRKIDILVGGPPCQSYSTLGKREMDDRANLFMQYKRILKITRPKLFVYENVLGLLSMEKGKLFKRIQKEFEELGYSLKYEVMNAADYGVPQLRDRVILVGMLGENTFTYPNKTHGEGLLPYVTLADAIGDLPELKGGEVKEFYLKAPDNDFLHFVRRVDPKILTEHEAPINHDGLQRIMETLKDGQTKDDLPEHIRPKSGFGNTYAKLWWNKPSTTITRNFSTPSSSRCIHPRDSRALTIREGARLQSFPDDYQLYGSKSSKRLAIGNAVPPLLSVAIAKEVSKALSV